MAASGDSLLVRAGLVRADQLVEAQRLRTKGGGTIGEWLVRLGAVTEDQLVDFYHLRLLVPRIGDAQFGRVTREALAAVPVDMALEFRVFPIALDAQNVLTLAMADPADTHVAEEVAFYSGRSCHRAVATATAIQAAIERHYRPRSASSDTRQAPGPGAVRPTASMIVVAPEAPPTRQTNSMMAVAPEPPPARQTASMIAVAPQPDPPPASPPAGAPRRSTSPLIGTAVPPPPDEPMLLTQVKGEATAEGVPQPVKEEPSGPPGRPKFVTQSRAAVARGGEPHVDPPARAATPLPLRPVTPAATPAVRSTTPLATPARNRARTLPGLSLLPELPIEALRAAASPEAVSDTLLAFATQISPAAAILVIRKGALVGQDARGPSVDVEAVRRINIPVDEPSLFRDVVQSRLPYRGPASDIPAHRAMLAALGGLRGEVLLLPFCVGDKAIGVLFAAGMSVPLPEAGLGDLAREAGQAWERLIRTGRK